MSLHSMGMYCKSTHYYKILQGNRQKKYHGGLLLHARLRA